jgi:hypothetical protein
MILLADLSNAAVAWVMPAAATAGLIMSLSTAGQGAPDGEDAAQPGLPSAVLIATFKGQGGGLVSDT